MKNDATINKNLPYIMHIDLNSCFAIIEQQANRLLRGRPVGVAAYDTPRGFVVAASYEAKYKNVKLGVNVEQSRSLAPGIVIMTPDPPKYREAHRLFKAVLLEYSPNVTPKSIDEFILDMEHSTALKSTKSEIRNSKQILNSKRNMKHEKRNMSSEYERKLHNQAMLKIGKEIKTKIAERLGEWVTVNIGISTNRFLAKYAAGFDKPDGMTLIDHKNLRSKYENMALVDLPGINTRYRARLRVAGIYTPLEFLDADMQKLKKQVFKSINGYHWYMRLRGYEADAIEFSQKSIGHQHAISDKTMDLDKLERLLMKLCEKTGRRLRKSNYYASGIHLYIGFAQDSTQYTVDGLQFDDKEQDGGQYTADGLVFANGEAKRQKQEEEPASFEHTHKMKSWHHGERVYHRLYSTQEIYHAAKKLLHSAEISNRVKIISVHVFDLHPWNPVQTSLFEQNEDWGLKIGDSPYRKYDSEKRISDSVDAINTRYGEFVITPAAMLDMQGTILDRIAFGQVRDL